MAGKRSAREVLDEWQQKMKQKALDADEFMSDPAVVQDILSKTNAAREKYLPLPGDPSAIEKATIKGQDLLGGAQSAMQAGSQALKQGAQQGMQGAQDIYSAAQAAAPYMMQAGRNAMASQPSAYDQEMMGMDMETTPETKAYYDKMLADSQMPMAQKAGQAVGGLLDSAGDAYDKVKGMGGQFMQGMQGGQPQQAAPQIDPVQIQQLLQTLTPEQKAALMQQLGGGQ